MAEKKIFGHIDCPTCGTAKGMRITHDKNGHPFGYCEAECNQQMRIGGDARRVRKFLERFPWAAGAEPVTDTEKTRYEEHREIAAKPETVPAAKAEPKAAPKAAAKPRSALDDAVKFLTGG